MKVVLKAQMSGTRNGEEWPAKGETIDLPKDEAEALVALGNAVLSKDVAVVEQATAVPGQKRSAKGKK